MTVIHVYFSEYFHVDPEVLDDYGAFDISVVSDLPLFVDPFLLFNSEDETYQRLHDEIIRYLRFLRDRAAEGDLDPKLIDAWYRFKEVKQNWLGFTMFGNEGAGLGAKFARALHGSLGEIFQDFGEETVTEGTHLEKLCLIEPGVGQDSISDFTTNLIKAFLCDYTQTFAQAHLSKDRCDTFAVPKVRFDYRTRTWTPARYYLPRREDDFVLLTPQDILTRDNTWINHSDMVARFWRLPEAISNGEQRAQINQYLERRLGEEPSAAEKKEAIAATIRKFPELIDQYIRLQEDDGDRAEDISDQKVQSTIRQLVTPIQEGVEYLSRETDFFEQPWTSYEECLSRVLFFKSYIENNDGYQLFNYEGEGPSTEKELQLAFGFVWNGSEFDINRETNNGRGPVDFKASFGAGDKSLIEFKLASNRSLKRNLAKQVPIYEAANRTDKTIKVIVFYSEEEEARVRRILQELDVEGEESIVLIDARNDNKPSASKAK